jgi:hypothetical protein
MRKYLFPLRHLAAIDVNKYNYTYDIFLTYWLTDYV